MDLCSDCSHKNWNSLLWLLQQELEFFALVAQTRIVILFVLIARAKLVIFYFVAQTRI
jgi:hypothetical protein